MVSPFRVMPSVVTIGTPSHTGRPASAQASTAATQSSMQLTNSGSITSTPVAASTFECSANSRRYSWSPMISTSVAERSFSMPSPGAAMPPAT